jgi:hypothetical protein
MAYFMKRKKIGLERMKKPSVGIINSLAKCSLSHAACNSKLCCLRVSSSFHLGCAVAQAVSCRLLTAAARV